MAVAGGSDLLRSTPLIYSLLFSASTSHLRTASRFGRQVEFPRGMKGRGGCRSRVVVVFSSHSNHRILKNNRKSRSGYQLYASDDDESEDGKGFSDASGDEPLQSSENDVNSSASSTSMGLDSRKDLRQGIWRPSLPDRNSKCGTLINTNTSSTYIREVKQDRNIPDKINTRDASIMARYQRAGSACKNSIRKDQLGTMTESKLLQMLEELDFDEKWFPLIQYLSTFGLKESHFVQIYERHMPSLQINVASARERLEYLLSVGVKQRDVAKIILRQPQVLEYTIDNILKPHVVFLTDIGVPDSKVGQVIAAAPSLLSYSIEHSLKPTVKYLVEEVGLSQEDLGKVVQLSPQILVQKIDNSWRSRFSFLSRELGASKQCIAKMVKKHPQLLHYSIEDGILPRINFLRSIGMRNPEILKMLTSITQVLSLSLENNLRPKYLYLVNELQNEVRSLSKYPTYFSLSLEQRIRPRHKFLVSLKKAPKGPFPLSSFVLTDESFCQRMAGTSLDKYLEFRQSLLLTDFAKKYQQTRRNQ
ncbi:transcription termination factor MTERF9, chloroplastic [Nymphaea colorata]|nr:transcription termination factor MTERF9, chloroplastic [Nymphaea colorata]